MSLNGQKRGKLKKEKKKTCPGVDVEVRTMVGFVGMFSRLRVFLLFSLDTFLAERGGGNIDLTTAPAYKAPFTSSLYYLALAKKGLSPSIAPPTFFLVSRN